VNPTPPDGIEFSGEKEGAQRLTLRRAASGVGVASRPIGLLDDDRSGDTIVRGLPVVCNEVLKKAVGVQWELPGATARGD
jgi:hypothetical protein